ncbi:pre-mRNA-splicing factor CWC22 homolog [Cardiocondyla obscurior]|uniref:pre-mRNA-splicing factor CWC22 homolog n=1 Tax=Cardiocondyla obscurior TaxID=286306 RepID=UPI00396577CD
MKRSRKDEDDEEHYRKRRDHKSSRRGDERRSSRRDDDHRGDEHRSSRRNDGHRGSRRDDNYRSSRRENHRDRRYNDDRGDSRYNDEADDRRKSEPREEIGSRYYGEPDKPRENPEEAKQKRTVGMLTSRTGGAYIPPAKLRMLQAEITDKSGAAYQRIAWEALKKSIHGYINKVNTSNIGIITRELLQENIVRGRGLLARSVIQAQAASLTFTPVYAALTAIINYKFPNIGELVLKRLVLQFKRGFKRNDKPLCISSGTFIAHLVNQRVAYEIIALEILTLLLETPTDDSVEVAIAFLKECGMKLTEVSRRGIEAIFEMLRNILHEGQLDKRVQYMIEVMFQIRKDGFKDHEAVPEELDLVEEKDQITHLIRLDDEMDAQDILNVFKFDADYLASEEKYKELCKEILGSDVSDSEDDDEDGEEDSSDNDTEQTEGKESVITDNTETNLTALRRTIYLTIHSSLDFEECAHKLMKMQLKPGQEIELCHMFLDCCAEMRTYEKFFGLLAGRFCAINKIYVTPFEQIFKDSYHTIHRLDTNKLRNVSKFFAHLLFTDSISWSVLSCIQLNEEDTTSSSRIFIKILFQELSEYMGLAKLNERVKDVTLQEVFEGLFPRDDPRKTRFAINFFTSIGLGGLTDDLREHLKKLKIKQH